MQVNSKHVIYVLLAVIFVMFLVIIFREPNDIAGTNPSIENLKKTIQEKDSLINAYRLEAERYQHDADVFSAKADSLDSVKQKVKIKYEKIYINIANATSNKQLDSIIRANWR